MSQPQPCSLCGAPEPAHDDARCSFGWTPALPPLRVWTARISYRGPDRLDITRKSAGLAGIPFAPSWAILRPALDARRTGDPKAEAEAWARYVPAYTAEMRVSYRAHSEAWSELLARREVTLCCYCVDPERCHRRLLAGMLAKCGAADMGERT